MNRLMDELDIASELEMEQRDAAIEQARKPPQDSPRYVGVCLFCEASLAAPRRFCDGWCREGWEKHKAAVLRSEGPFPLREEPFDAE